SSRVEFLRCDLQLSHLSCCLVPVPLAFHVFFFNHTATPEIYTLSLHDALPIYQQATTNQNVKKRPACSELRWAYCNHKATYFASYLTGGDCVPDDQN